MIEDYQTHGVDHWQAKHSFEYVEKIRDMNDQGMSVKRIALKENLPVDTVRDWVYFRTRRKG